MDIDYNLSGTTAPATVSLRISNDDGATFGIPSNAVSGAIGGGIASGQNKRIVWNAGADWNNSLSPGASTTFKVTFKPTAKGTRNAAVHIMSNDANENPFDIKIVGLGSR